MTWTIAKSIASDTLRARVRWVADMLNASESIAAKIGISPEAIVAQAALESGWGSSRQGDHGLFGQKATKSWTGLKVLCRTREFIGGEYITIDDWFCDYPSLEACLDDHFAFLQRNTRYRDAGVFDGNGDEHYFESLQKAGYATDPNYARSLMAVEDTITDYFMPYLINGVPARPTEPLPKRVLFIHCRPGDDIKALQTVLANLGLYSAVIDGDFGMLTYDAVTAFQRRKAITVDGVVGDETRRALGLETH